MPAAEKPTKNAMKTRELTESVVILLTLAAIVLLMLVFEAACFRCHLPDLVVPGL